MEQYDDTFQAKEAQPPSIKEIEKRLQKLGRHIDHVTKSRIGADQQNAG